MLSIFRRPRLWILILASPAFAALVFWYSRIHTPPVPRRTLRIGFEPIPLMQIKTETGLSGLSVDTVREAAKRAGVSLQWVETGTSSDEAFQRGLVDLWPAMVDLPDRRKRLHITRAWMHTSHALVLRADREAPGGKFAGRIAFLKLPVNARLALGEFPQAQLVEYPEIKEIMKAVCGGVAAGFLEGRSALASLREKPVECGTTELRIYPLRDLTMPLGIGSTFEAAGAADKIRDQIGGMFRDGTLAATMAKYSYYGLDDTWATYDLMSAIERARLMGWVMSVVAVGLTLALWQTFALRQRKRSENRLRESEERFRRVFEEGPLGLALVGKDYRFVKVNSALCRMLGYDESELIQVSFVDITHPDDVSTNVELAEQLFKRKIPFYRLQKRYVKKTGEVIWINLTVSNLLGSDGKPIHGLAMIEDITEIKRTQEDTLFRQKLESVGTLAGGIAHDFNNLLGGIRAQAELATAELATGESCLENIETITNVTDRGAEIVRELMIYSGQDKPGPVEPIDLPQLVEEMLELFKVSVSKHAVLKTDFSDDVPTVLGRASQLRQILMNLIINASEAIGEKGGTIRIAASRATLPGNRTPVGRASLPPGEYLNLEVSDTGVGMTEDVKAKVFDPFFSTKFAGRGLGLAVVHGLVRDLGGSIYVMSEPGRGSTFQIMLPAAATAVREINSPVPVIKDRRIASSQGFGVLVAEDEAPLRYAVASMLRKEGFGAVHVGSGSAALGIIRSDLYRLDVLFLDLNLPGAPSRQILQEARRVRPEMKVIVTSAYAEDVAAAALQGDVERFLRKPYKLSDLIDLLRTL